MPDHVHCLFLLNQQKAVSEVIKYIKGTSSQTINSQILFYKSLPGKLAMLLIP
ncbi:MAG: hypothetical protein C4308_00740 [Chitinophagaceae bacterium]